MRPEVRRYSAALKDAWDAFVDSAKNATFLFRRDFMEYHADRFRDHSLVVFDGQTPVAVLPANEEGGRIVSHGGLTYGGLVVSTKAGIADIQGIFGAVLDYYATRGFTELLYKRMPAFYFDYPADEDEYVLYRRGARLVKRDTGFVIALPEKPLSSPTARWASGRAVRAGVTIARSRDFAGFWSDILVPHLLARFGNAPVHSAGEIARLAEQFPDHIELHVARREGKLVAGTVLFVTKTALHAQYIGSNEAGRAVRALDLLFTTLIEQASCSHLFFSLGTSNFGGELNDGVVQWKEKHGARTISNSTYSIELRPVAATGKIVPNDFRRRWAEVGNETLAAVARVGASGRYILGDEVARFERRLASFWGLRHAVGTGNGMDAIEIGLRACGLRAGARVLTTPLSAFATTLAILRAGGIPVFVDVDASGLMDLAAAERALAARPDVRFAVPVHLYGHCLDLDRLAYLKEKFGLTIVEDCAQAIGATFDGAAAGTIGDAAAVSFYPTKNLGALGDGGALLTNDDAVARAARSLGNYGQTARYAHAEAGLNSRLDEVQAAILQVGLDRLIGWTAARRRTAARYLEGIRAPGLAPVRPPEGSDSVFHCFPVRVQGDRAAFLAHLEARGIRADVHYPTVIPDQPALRRAPSEIAGAIATAKAIAASVASLPVHPQLTDGEGARIIEACNAWPDASGLSRPPANLVVGPHDDGIV